MTTLAWDDRYRIGLPIIDNQHKYLLQLINQLYDDIATEAPPATFDAVFDNLDDYAIYHFTLEKRWMQGQHYDELAAHQQEHASFRQHIIELRRQHRCRDRYAALKTLTFLYHWLTTHIQGSDVHFGQFIARNPASATALQSAAGDGECSDRLAGTTTPSNTTLCC